MVKRTPVKVSTDLKTKKELPKLTADISILLATWIAGAAIVEVMQDYCMNNNPICFNWVSFFPASALILTTLRFFHGNVMWSLWNVSFKAKTHTPKSTPTQEFFHKFSSYYFHIFQYILFFIAAKTLNNQSNLLKVLLLISIVDVIWTALSYLTENDNLLRRAVTSWFWYNFVTSLVVAALIYVDINDTFSLKFWIPHTIGFFYGLVAFLDYYHNRLLFLVVV